MSSVKLSILIVSWNTKELLRQCVESIFEHVTNIDYEIIIVDNNSQDGTQAMIEELFITNSNHLLICNDYNSGFAHANNQAYEVSSGEIVALVNSDIMFKDNSLLKLVEFLENTPDCGIVSSDLVGYDMQSQSLHRGFPKISTVFFTMTSLGRFIDLRVFKSTFSKRYRLRNFERKGTQIVDQAAGALMVMKRTTIEAIGGLFDERFPIYGNDVDLSKRIWDFGLRIYVLYDLVVVHKGSASLNKINIKKKQNMQRQWLYDYYDKHENLLYKYLLRLFIRKVKGNHAFINSNKK